MNFSPDIGSPSGWNPPPAAEQYMMLIREVEKANGIPRNLYARLLEQESSWRRDYIYGPTTSPVGAQGIAQVMPATAAGAGYGMPVLRNPFDPVKAIPWGAKYLAALRRSLGSWQYALAAYNAGAGNVQKALRNAGPNWLSTLPRETQNYVADITGDVPVA